MPRSLLLELGAFVERSQAVYTFISVISFVELIERVSTFSLSFYVYSHTYSPDAFADDRRLNNSEDTLEFMFTLFRDVYVQKKSTIESNASLMWREAIIC